MLQGCFWSNEFVNDGETIDCGLICLEELRNIRVNSVSEANRRSEVKASILRIRRSANSGAPHHEMRLSYWESVRPH